MQTAVLPGDFAHVEICIDAAPEFGCFKLVELSWHWTVLKDANPWTH